MKSTKKTEDLYIVFFAISTILLLFGMMFLVDINVKNEEKIAVYETKIATMEAMLKLHKLKSTLVDKYCD